MAGLIMLQNLFNFFLKVLVYEDGKQICGCRLCGCGSILSHWQRGSQANWLLLAVGYGRWMFLTTAHSCWLDIVAVGLISLRCRS
ncbi:hypothetical protein SLEP1_g39390 [Rubroshorea leprosula]|uniref:Uncharacterized protein n=1 Tax=Rubroshorea leprosula TaxID=152421 RepID=A0AAV5L022_9ROSI|nr:hypothetical protein SLEP1_g39390 [Rubroshorea leprosula]